ncbi:MAG TPA: hypothetical protein VN728_06825 [Stellaceae bacterium]|jgi:hypothetical protein|nr:hypothetical protein [Stellaceae bacterium]
MFIVEDEELRLRHELARYRCLLDSGADEETDLRLRDAIMHTKARLSQLEALRIGDIATPRHPRPSGQGRTRLAFARLKFAGRRS